MKEPKPMNTWLIAFTLLWTVLAKTSRTMVRERHNSGLETLTIVLITLALLPVIFRWVQAMWNTVVPRITGAREISIWETVGVALLLLPLQIGAPAELTELLRGYGLNGFVVFDVLALLFLVYVGWTRFFWNKVMPSITGWRTISYWEATGVIALAFLV